MKQPPAHTKPKRLTAVLLSFSLLCLAGCKNAAPETPASSIAAATRTAAPVATTSPSTTVMAASFAEPAPPETAETPETTAATEQMTETEAQPETETEAESETEPEPEAQPEDSYVLNTNSKKFHLPNCGSVKKMKDKNRKDVVDTRDNIISQGYTPCKNCRP